MTWFNSRLSRNKFRARPIHNLMTGQSFDSTGESTRYKQLQLLERAGHISNLKLHEKIVLVAKTVTAPEIAWKMDYTYTEYNRMIAEDYKPRPHTSRETLLFKLWQHFGPCPLRITGVNGKLKRQIHGRR